MTSKSEIGTRTGLKRASKMSCSRNIILPKMNLMHLMNSPIGMRRLMKRIIIRR